MTFLYMQYLFFTIGSEVPFVVCTNLEQKDILSLSLRALAFLLVLPTSLYVRTKVAHLDDEDLKEFLSIDVLKGGIFVGLGQLLFLAFASVQCHSEARLEGYDWRECKRSLFSQTGE